MKLLAQALIKFICGILLVALLVFLPAGTLQYVGGWVLMGVLFLPILAVGVVLFCKAPALLAERLNGKEKANTQKGVVAVAGVMFLVGFVLAGLDFRFGWSRLPFWVTVVAAVLFLAAYGMYAEVLRENAYLSRTIKVQENQKVVDTGLYGIVRHPMYAATVLLFLMIPLMLGSLYAFLVFLAYPVVIAVRIRDEERLLCEQLEGYMAYTQKVKYRVLPFIW